MVIFVIAVYFQIFFEINVNSPNKLFVSNFLIMVGLARLRCFLTIILSSVCFGVAFLSDWRWLYKHCSL